MQRPIPSESLNVEIITIGREILDGRVVDTNSTFLGYELGLRGLTPRYAQRVDDDPKRILEAFRIASSRSHIILVTGGLGPTEDDLTAQVFGDFLGEPLTKNTEAENHIRDYFSQVQRPLHETQFKQALLPVSVEILKNNFGTAPGFWKATQSSSAGIKSQRWFFMPGVPREMKPMFLQEILTKIPESFIPLQQTWCTHFTSEGELQNRLFSFIQKLKSYPELELTFRTRFPENHIGLYAKTPSFDAKLFGDFSKEISETLGNDVFYTGPLARELEAQILTSLKKAGAGLATIESCTGGLIAHRITSVPGASETFLGSWVTYDNLLKIDLGVNPETLASHGAVSSACAREMAEAGLRKIQKLIQTKKPNNPHSNIFVLSTTGIAGPAGGSKDKPVGLCHIALAHTRVDADTTTCIDEKFQGRIGLERDLLKLAFSQKALDLLRRHLNSLDN